MNSEDNAVAKESIDVLFRYLKEAPSMGEGATAGEIARVESSDRDMYTGVADGKL